MADHCKTQTLVRQVGKVHVIDATQIDQGIEAELRVIAQACCNRQQFSSSHRDRYFTPLKQQPAQASLKDQFESGL